MNKWRRRFLPKDGAAGKTVHGFDSITNPDVEVWIEIAAYEDMKSEYENVCKFATDYENKAVDLANKLGETASMLIAAKNAEKHLRDVVSELRSDIIQDYKDSAARERELATKLHERNDQISCMESEDALNADSFHAYELKVKALEKKLAASERVKLYAIEQFTKACVEGDSVGLSEFDMTIKELEVIK